MLRGKQKGFLSAIVVVVAFFFLFITPRSIEAIGLRLENFDVMGLNCGVADSPNNKCCGQTKMTYDAELKSPKISSQSGTLSQDTVPATYENQIFDLYLDNKEAIINSTDGLVKEIAALILIQGEGARADVVAQMEKNPFTDEQKARIDSLTGEEKAIEAFIIMLDNAPNKSTWEQIKSAPGEIVGGAVNIGKRIALKPINLIGGVADIVGNIVIDAGTAGMKFLVNFMTATILDKADRISTSTNRNLVKNGVNTVCLDDGVPSTEDVNDPSCICQAPVLGVNEFSELCANIKNPVEKNDCEKCVLTDGGNLGGTWTGIGCVPANLGSFFTQTFFRFGTGLAGGFSFLCILYSAYILMTSRGNPERIKKSKEYLTSCIVGLLLVIFSVFILHILGVEILKIPGLSGASDVVPGIPGI